MTTPTVSIATDQATSQPISQADDMKTLKKRFNSIVREQYLNMLSERLLPRLVPGLCVAGLFAGSVLSGFWAVLPLYGKAAGMMMMSAATIAAFKPMLDFRAPKMREAIQRIDAQSGLPNQAAETLYSEFKKADGQNTDGRWQLHIERLLSQNLPHLKASAPVKTDMFESAKTPLLSVTALALAAALYSGYGEYQENTANAFDFTVPYEVVVPRIDAWVTKPAYTGSYEQYIIADDTNQSLAPTEDALRSLEGSTLNVRLFDDETQLNVISGGLQSDGASIQPRLESNGARLYTIELEGDTQIQFTRRTWESPLWSFTPSRDTAPTLDIQARQNETGHTDGFQVTIGDDFGADITGTSIRLRDLPQSDSALPQFQTPELNLR
jgi:hypothetical protein